MPPRSAQRGASARRAPAAARHAGCRRRGSAEDSGAGRGRERAPVGSRACVRLLGCRPRASFVRVRAGRPQRQACAGWAGAPARPQRGDAERGRVSKEEICDGGGPDAVSYSRAERRAAPVRAAPSSPPRAASSPRPPRPSARFDRCWCRRSAGTATSGRAAAANAAAVARRRHPEGRRRRRGGRRRWRRERPRPRTSDDRAVRRCAAPAGLVAVVATRAPAAAVGPRHDREVAAAAVGRRTPWLHIKTSLRGGRRCDGRHLIWHAALTQRQRARCRRPPPRRLHRCAEGGAAAGAASAPRARRGGGGAGGACGVDDAGSSLRVASREQKGAEGAARTAAAAASAASAVPSTDGSGIASAAAPAARRRQRPARLVGRRVEIGGQAARASAELARMARPRRRRAARRGPGGERRRHARRPRGRVGGGRGRGRAAAGGRGAGRAQAPARRGGAGAGGAASARRRRGVRRPDRRRRRAPTAASRVAATPSAAASAPKAASASTAAAARRLPQAGASGVSKRAVAWPDGVGCSVAGAPSRRIGCAERRPELRRRAAAPAAGRARLATPSGEQRDEAALVAMRRCSCARRGAGRDLLLEEAAMSLTSIGQVEIAQLEKCCSPDAEAATTRPSR